MLFEHAAGLTLDPSVCSETWRVTGRGVPGLNSKKRKAEHSFSITEKQTWAIRERKTKAKRNIRKRLSVVQRKNDN